ncbi:hypothetical protein RCL1_005321 [Eukaryota sp. TZLM3-RCL]
MGAGCSTSKRLPAFNFKDPTISESLELAKHGYVLTLRKNDLLEVAPFMQYYNHLQQLNLRRCFCSDDDQVYIPRAFCQLKRLINIELMNMSFKNKLTSDIYNPFLDSLLIEHCELSKIPPGLAVLKNLKVFDLSDNCLSSIPEEFSLLTSLEVLNLSSNFFLTFPLNVKSIPKLKILDIRDNQMDFLNPECLLSCPNLTSILASSNRFTSLPPELISLNNLQKIDVSMNRLNNIPLFIKDLKALIWIDFSNNPFDDLEFVPGRFSKDQLEKLFEDPLALRPLPIAEPTETSLPSLLCFVVLSDNNELFSELMTCHGRDLIASSASTPSVFYNSFSAVHVCCLKNRLNFLVEFSKIGADLNSISNGYTPIMLASKAGHLEILKFLIKNSVNFKASPFIPRPDSSQTVFGCIQVPRLPSPLQIAIESSNRAIVQFLINKGVDPRPLLIQHLNKVPGTENMFKDAVLKRLVLSLSTVKNTATSTVDRKWHQMVTTTMLVNLAVSKFKRLLVVAEERRKAQERGEVFDPVVCLRSVRKSSISSRPSV